MNDPVDDEKSMDLRPIVRSELTTPPVEPRSWYLTGGASYIGLFAWGPFFDQLWIGPGPGAGLGWLIAKAFVASALCLVLFFFTPARLGFESRRRLGIVAASTFGTTGSELLTGIGIALASVVWLAVAVNFAVDSTFLGLTLCGLVERAALERSNFGPLPLKSIAFCATALFWIFIAGMSSLLKLTGVVVALMRVYSPVALLLLTATAAWFVPGLVRSVTAGALIPIAGSLIIPSVLGFFAMPGMMAVDWGAMANGRRDLMRVGFLSVFLASWWTSIMALVVVAGATEGWESAFVSGSENLIPLSYRWAIVHGVGGHAGGTILILFGLAAMANACYAIFVLGERLTTHWPRLPHWAWTWLGGAGALILAITGSVDRLDRVYAVMGLVFAPAVGAIVGNHFRPDAGWKGVRMGRNPAGLWAWAAGVAAGAAFELWRIALPEATQPLPSAVSGFLVSATAYLVLAASGLERPVVAIDPLDPPT